MIWACCHPESCAVAIVAGHTAGQHDRVCAIAYQNPIALVAHKLRLQYVPSACPPSNRPSLHVIRPYVQVGPKLCGCVCRLCMKPPKDAIIARDSQAACSPCCLLPNLPEAAIIVCTGLSWKPPQGGMQYIVCANLEDLHGQHQRNNTLTGLSRRSSA